MYVSKNSEIALKEDMVFQEILNLQNEGYALAKITTAKLCEFAHIQKGLNYKTIIPCNLYGKYDKFDPDNSHLIPGVIRKVHNATLENHEPEIWGDGSAREESLCMQKIFLILLNGH